MEVFKSALDHSKNPVCYNGDIFTKEDFEKFTKEFPEVDAVMLGRGLLRNPGLGDEIREGKQLTKDVVKAFHDELCCGYQEIMSGDRNVLFKMKEVWFYLGQSFDGADKYLKEIRKTNKFSEYQSTVESLFVKCELK